MTAQIIRRADGVYERQSDELPQEADERYWATAEDPSKTLWSLVKTLRNAQSWRRQSDDLALRLYSDMRYVGYRSLNSNYIVDDVLETRIGDNVIRAIIRVLNSKIARRRARPYVVTNGASWEQRQAAENLEKWLLGKLREQEADEKLFPMFRLHSLVFGTGIIRVYSTLERGACAEVIPANEIVVDDSEARYGEPRNIYFVRTVSLNKLKYDYPDKKDLLDKVVPGSAGMAEWYQGVGGWEGEHSPDVCVVIEAYHLPSGPGAGDGRHVIISSSGTLLDEEWKRDHFPIALMRGELRPAGLWGIGVPEDLAGTQIEITNTAVARQEIVNLCATPYWLVERGMKVQQSAISNLVGRVMEWTSTGSPHKPELVAPPAVPPDIWQHQTALKQTAFENRGISQLAAQMVKPAGLNSGKALRAFSDFENELLSDLMNAADASLMKVCQLLIEEQQELAAIVEGLPDDDEGKAAKKKFAEQAVTHVGEGEVESIKWSDTGLDKALKTYVIEIMPASALASTLSGRIEDVQDLKDLGALQDPSEIWDYIDMPDMKRLRKKKLSSRRMLEKVIEFKIIKKGEDVQPEPTWDLNLAAEMALESLAELENYEDAPQDRLELLRKFVMKLKALLDLQNPPPPTPTLEELQAQQAAQNGLGNLPPEPLGANPLPELPPGALPGGASGGGPVPGGGAPPGAPLQ